MKKTRNTTNSPPAPAVLPPLYQSREGEAAEPTGVSTRNKK